MNLKILVATHKKYQMPKDSIYLPIHAGKELSKEELPYTGDNTGKHISAKNPNYCELTALYWAWKNLDADFIGLVHYRRHFTVHKPFLLYKDKYSYILNKTDAESLLQDTSVVLPKKRNYFIETNYSQFIHSHPKESLSVTKDVLAELFPAYLPAFHQVMKSTKGHRFNMFIMKRNTFDDYCHWLFSILFELEQRLDISGYDAYNKRIFGFISERLLDVYLVANNIPFKETGVIFMENEHWPRKIVTFLKKKLMNLTFHS